MSWETKPLVRPEWPAMRPWRSTMPYWRDWKPGSWLSISIIRPGSVPRCNSSKTTVWFWWVAESTPAWQAATPLPGTTTAWTSFKKSSVLPVQVEEEMTTRPVARSTATTDQVAKAEGVRQRARNRIVFRTCAIVSQDRPYYYPDFMILSGYYDVYSFFGVEAHRYR